MSHKAVTEPDGLASALAADWRDEVITKVEAKLADQYAVMTGNQVSGTLADLFKMLVEFVMSLLSGCMTSDSANGIKAEVTRPLGRFRQAALRVRIRELRRDEPLARQLTVEQIETLSVSTARSLPMTDLNQFIQVSRVA